MLSPTLSPSYQPPSSSDNSESHWGLQYYPLLLFVIVILFVVAEGSKSNPYDHHRRFIRNHFRRRRTDSQPENDHLPPSPPEPNPARDVGSAVCEYRLEKNIAGSDCVICLEDFKLGDQCRVFLNCNHGFHKDCIDRWLALDFHCPLCRGSIHGFTQV